MSRRTARWHVYEIIICMCLYVCHKRNDILTEANEVTIKVDVLDVMDVNDKEFSVTMTMYFSVLWNEPRLETNKSVAEGTPIDLQFLNQLWVPNIFIYDLRSFTALNVLKKLAGLWIINGNTILYNQASMVTFSCPMRFDLYPLDSHVCKFRVGSTNLDITRMVFAETELGYDKTTRNTILDYAVEMGRLDEKDRILYYGELGNYSITGVEIRFTRHKLKYMYMYYLPSGKLSIVHSMASTVVRGGFTDFCLF